MKSSSSSFPYEFGYTVNDLLLGDLSFLHDAGDRFGEIGSSFGREGEGIVYNLSSRGCNVDVSDL